jgi:hypothetical protein
VRHARQDSTHLTGAVGGPYDRATPAELASSLKEES